MCNGTTGREGLPQPALPVLPDATAGDDAGMTFEAGVVDGEGGPDSLLIDTFDADILYADRSLPEVQAPPIDGGMAETGPTAPSCPPFLPTDGVGNVVDFTASIQQVPADIGPDGGEVIASDASVCGAYPWLGSLDVDDCVATAAAPSFGMLPPCVAAIDAGNATHGSAAGQSRYALCMALYDCYLRTGCYLDPKDNGAGATWCFCGAQPAQCYAQPNGACLREEINALEIAPSELGAMTSQIISNFKATSVNPVAVHELNYDMQQVTFSCIQAAQQAWYTEHDAAPE
jgi:hypothetical protein